MIAAQFTNQKRERLVLIPLSPPSGTKDDSTKNKDRKVPPGNFGQFNGQKLPSGPVSARVPSGGPSAHGPTGTRTT